MPNTAATSLFETKRSQFERTRFDATSNAPTFDIVASVSPLEATLFAAASLGVLFGLRRLGRDRYVDLSGLTRAFAPLNAARFALRRSLGWSRGAPKLENEAKERLFDYLDPPARKEAAARAMELAGRYDLSRLERESTKRAYRENLYVLDALDRDGPELPSNPLIVDVGSKDFIYASALSAFAKRFGEPEIHGVEIDGHVIYQDLRSRADYAAAYTRVAGTHVHYHVQDFLAFKAPRPAALVTMFFPFVTRFALLRWGLPVGVYRPEAMLAHAAKMLSPGGALLVMNHTHEERQALLLLAAEISSLERISTRQVDCPLVDYASDVPERTVTVFRRI
jgi:hypothetical protein